MSSSFEMRMRIYHEDTDASGIVYHPIFLSFMSRARMEWLRTLPNFIEALRTHDIITPIRSADLNFYAPAFLDDEILVVTRMKAFKPVSALFFQEIYRYNTDTLLCTGEIKLACVQKNDFSICRWPLYDELLKNFT